jgi:hypothetical protein
VTAAPVAVRRRRDVRPVAPQRAATQRSRREVCVITLSLFTALLYSVSHIFNFSSVLHVPAFW